MRNNFKDTWILTRANLTETYGLSSINKIFSTENGNLLKVMLLTVVIFMLLPMSYTFYATLGTIIYRTQGPEALNMLIYLSIFIVFISTMFTCMYKATSFLFSFKDFNMLASFPVSAVSIFSSRLIILYISSLFINIVAGFPAILVFGAFTNANIFYYIYAITLFLMFSVVPLILGSIISFAIAKIASGFKNTNYFMALGSIVVILFSFYLTSISQNMLVNESLDPLESLTNIMSYYLPGVLFVKAITETSFIWFTVSLIFNIALLILFAYVFSSNFKKLNSVLTETHKKSSYKLKSLNASSQLKALYKKELKTYFYSYTYMVNSSIGMVFLVLYALYIVIFGTQNISWGLNVNTVLLFIAMTCTTNVSFSIEGKSFYMLKSLPIRFNKIVLSKVLLNLTITTPLIVISSVILSTAFNVDALQTIILIAISFLLSVLISLNGVIINLFFPKLNFKSHVEIVKQSTSAFVSFIANIATYLFVIIINALFSSAVVILFIGLLIFIYWTFINKVSIRYFNEM